MLSAVSEAELDHPAAALGGPLPGPPGGGEFSRPVGPAAPRRISFLPPLGRGGVSPPPTGSRRYLPCRPFREM